MIQQALILSLQILAIHAITLPGMIAERPRAIVATWMDKTFGLKWSKTIQKPLWGCIICMSGIWTIILTMSFDLKLIFIVCGINVIADKLIYNE
ncbi:hypothetical protein ABDK00_014080 [Niabella insulamsoli]|uniref:hypothetical protein n=1 Tax=Niabella insulamsoli TaxID=3144874 RepID=UPI0031FD5AB0